MSEFPRIFGFPDPLVSITTFSASSLGGGGFGFDVPYNTSIAFPAANTAFFVPFRIARPFVFSNLFCVNGSTISGNVDVGVYSSDGTRIISVGGTTQAGGNTLQNFTVATTQIDSGQFYLAIAMDNASGRICAGVPSLAAMCSFTGMAQMASAYPLPATATFATMSYTFVPNMGLTSRSSI